MTREILRCLLTLIVVLASPGGVFLHVLVVLTLYAGAPEDGPPAAAPGLLAWTGHQNHRQQDQHSSSSSHLGLDDLGQSSSQLL